MAGPQTKRSPTTGTRVGGKPKTREPTRGTPLGTCSAQSALTTSSLPHMMPSSNPVGRVGGYDPDMLDSSDQCKRARAAMARCTMARGGVSRAVGARAVRN